jgi:4-amino-4-deoxy-L-arabinose transferase-like glycosyltransferase
VPQTHSTSRLTRTAAYALALLITLAGFTLRIWDLAGVPLRWDEGWSIAHAALSLIDILRITAQDVHPPLYYLLLGIWQHGAGLSPFAVRLFSVMAAMTSVPLCLAVGSAWAGRRAGLFAAAAAAWLPLAVYYGAVTRMYALAPSFVLLAMWGAARLSRRSGMVALALGCAGAMYTLYHAAWALVALVVVEALQVLRKVIIDGDKKITCRLSLSLLSALVAYLPWLLYGVPKLFGRAVAESATNTNQAFGIDYFLTLGARDLFMTQQAGDAALIAFAALFIAGIGAALRGRRRIAPLVPAFAMIVFTLLGVAIAARQWAFNARMLIAATPALALAIGWSFDALARSRSGRAVAAALLVVITALYAPTSTRFVYEKSLEVFAPYSTTTYREHIAPHAQPNDIVIFNVLSPAGFYASQRASNDPAWTYALTWDPVREPVADWQARLRTAAQRHDRMWLVLYRGLAQNSNNGDLRGWLDSNFYPARSEWGDEEVFYGLYGVADESAMQPGATAQWPGVTLTASAVSPDVRPGGIATVKLTWRITAPITRSYKVFVHVMKPDGFVIGQHDAAPLNDLRPFPALAVGELVEDRHGVVLPTNAAGPLRIVVGLYDPETGTRLLTTDGRDAVEIRGLK